MDLVEVARIAARRWYVVALVLVLGVGSTIAVAWSIAPQYRVEAQSILISGRSAPTADGPSAVGNPYQAFSGSLFTTLSAVTRTVDGREFRERLDAEGEVRDFEFSTSQEAPVIITESFAGSPDEATDLSSEVQMALAETLATLQGAEDVPEDQQIVLRVLTTSAPVQETGSRTRVLFGGIGLTLAAAVAAAVLVESIARTRRTARDEKDPVEDEHAPGGEPVRGSSDVKNGWKERSEGSGAAPPPLSGVDDEDEGHEDATDEADGETGEGRGDGSDTAGRGARAVDV